MSVGGVAAAQQLLHGLRGRGEGRGGGVGVQAGAGHLGEVVVRRDDRREGRLAAQRRVAVGALLRGRDHRLDLRRSTEA